MGDAALGVLATRMTHGEVQDQKDRSGAPATEAHRREIRVCWPELTKRPDLTHKRTQPNERNPVFRGNNGLWISDGLRGGSVACQRP
jgi:hypothetical protein